eukprot:CAMPEP_0181110724 /NCGR_PEP_ID=MMETSP1071-20121207/18872_1 /TAXON_ID=35127 /ORGANISM="Thalassiosira sp., Strain NH16" /LENGTH=151 /DNA_ID=CAMNT_0023194525 /DNA_START=120 /DNA_END=575 /DNA_ORIENTATION=+
MVNSMPLFVLSIVAVTSSAQLARGPERVRDAKNNAIMKSSSNTAAFDRGSSSGNLRGERGLQQLSMSMDVEAIEYDESSVVVEEPLSDPNTCDIGHQDSCEPGKACVIPVHGIGCNPIVTVPYLCEGVCIPIEQILDPIEHIWNIVGEGGD